MFRCCQAPLQHGNELTFDTIGFPNDTKSRRRRQLLLGPDSDAPLSPVGTVQVAASPRKSGHKKSKSQSKKSFDASPQEASARDVSPLVSGLPLPTHNPLSVEPDAYTPRPLESKQVFEGSMVDTPTTRTPLSPTTPEMLQTPELSAPDLTLDANARRRSVTFSMTKTEIEPPSIMYASTTESVPLSAQTVTSPPVSEEAPPTVNILPPAMPSTTPTVTSPKAAPPTPSKTPPSSPSGATESRKLFKAKEAAPPSKSPRLHAGKAPPPSARSAGSPSGLRTKDRSKMVDLLDERVKKNVYVACNFVRETIDQEVAVQPAVCDREYAFVLWALIFAAQLECEGKQHPVATACAHIADLAQGDLATNAAKKAAPLVHFLTKAIVKPTLENLVTPDSKHDAMYIAKDIRDTARVTLGEKPPSLMERAPYLEKLLTQCNYAKLRQMSVAERQELFVLMVDTMADSRRGGDQFMKAVKAVEDRIFD